MGEYDCFWYAGCGLDDADHEHLSTDSDGLPHWIHHAHYWGGEP